jgi:uncharacterized protein (DUF2236 family)
MRPDPRTAVRLVSTLPGGARVARVGLAVPRRARRTFRTRVSGDPSGTPEWVRDIAQVGSGPGWFAPDGLVWRVHGDLSTLVGGIAALLAQAAHPLAVAGVEGHSSYRDAPWKRLAGTARWLVVTTFGAAELAEREAARVRGMHERVRGRLPDGRHYAADDPALLRWVHLAFTDAFLHAQLRVGDDLRPRFGRSWPDAYVAEWAPAASALGAEDLPTSATELDEAIHALVPELAPVPAQLRAFLLAPPGLSLVERAFYATLVRGGARVTHPAVAPLAGVPGREARGGRARLELAGVRAELRALHLVLGARSPSEEAARRRLGLGTAQAGSPQPQRTS